MVSCNHIGSEKHFVAINPNISVNVFIWVKLDSIFCHNLFTSSYVMLLVSS